MKSDIIVIGSGISGLTSATILAKKGYKVFLLEQERRIGGALKCFKRKGTSFDVGFHYTGCLGKEEILHKIFNYCGLDKSLSIIPFPKNGSDKLYIRSLDKEIDSFFSYERVKSELKTHFPQESKAIDSYYETIKEICSKNPFYNHELSLIDFLQQYRTSFLSLEDFLTSITSNPALQAIFAYPSVLYGIPTDNVSIDIHAMVAHGYYQGAYTVQGGGQAIVDGFVNILKELQVETFTSQRVCSVEINDNKTGSYTVHSDNGDTFRCKKIIYTGHPSHFTSIINTKAFRPAYIKRLRRLQNSLSMNAIFGTISNHHGALDWNNHFFLSEGPNPFAEKFNHINNRLLMLTSTERGSFALPPQDKSVILLQPAFWQDVEPFWETKKGNRPKEYLAYKEEITAKMLEKANTYWSDYLKDLEILAVGTPLTFRDELSAPEGCAYGAMHSLDQFTPDIRTKLPGLFLSGQSTLMTGVAGAAISGMVAAAHILGLETFWKEIRACS